MMLFYHQVNNHDVRSKVLLFSTRIYTNWTTEPYFLMDTLNMTLQDKFLCKNLATYVTCEVFKAKVNYFQMSLHVSCPFQMKKTAAHVQNQFSAKANLHI